MRLSQPYTEEGNVDAFRVERGAAVYVINRGKGPNMKVQNLKSINRTAYDDHIVMLEIDGKKAHVNIEDLRTALRYA